MVPLDFKIETRIAGCPPLRRTGSILIMVVVVLVLLVVIGAAYIQSARWDRIATHLVVTNNIDTVAAAVVNQIQSTLQKDIVDSAGNFLDETTNTEPYDYPSTNTTATAQCHAFTGQQLTPRHWVERTTTSGLPRTAPDFSTDPTAPIWPHVTNLNGVFLQIPGGGISAWTFILIVRRSPLNETDYSTRISQRSTGPQITGTSGNDSLDYDMRQLITP